MARTWTRTSTEHLRENLVHLCVCTPETESPPDAAGPVTVPAPAPAAAAGADEDDYDEDEEENGDAGTRSQPPSRPSWEPGEGSHQGADAGDEDVGLPPPGVPISQTLMNDMPNLSDRQRKEREMCVPKTVSR